MRGKKGSAWEKTSESGPVKSKKKRIFKIIISIILLIIIFGGIYLYFLFKPANLVEPKFSTENGGIITKQDFSNYLESHPAIQDLPKDSYIELNLGEDEYLISKEQVLIKELGNIESDIGVAIPEEYLSMVAEVGLCQTIGQIAKEGDFEIDTNLSTMELINKYKSLLKYKACLEV